MKSSDVRLIDPTFGELVTAVRKAVKAANGRVRQHRIEKDTLSWHRALRRVWRRAAGRADWPGKNSPYNAPLVRLAWWTDRLGRKHWRVLGCRRLYAEGWANTRALAKYDLWHVYPDRLLVRTAGGREDLLAACACGVVGTPEAISWTGQRCGPCHDRLEEGAPPRDRPFQIERKRHSAVVVQLAFLADGRMVSGGCDGRIVLWEADGESRALLHRPSGYVLALAVSAGGTVAASTAHSRLLLTDLDGPRDWQTVPLPGDYYHHVGCAFSPGGDWLFVGCGGRGYLLDPSLRRPALKPLADGRALIGGAFAADGRAVYAYDQSGTLLRIAVPSGGATVVREAPAQFAAGGHEDELELFLEEDFDGAPPLGCSPDGQWLVAAGGWDNHTGLHRCHLPSGSWVPLRGPAMYGGRSLAFVGPDELMSANAEGEVTVWSLRRPGPAVSWSVSSRFWYGAAFLSPGGEWLVHAHHDGTLEMTAWRELLAGAGGQRPASGKLCPV